MPNSQHSTRRSLLRAVLGTVVSAVLAPTASCLAQPAPTPAPVPARPPNIVFILADDMGWKDPSCYGSDFYETPNIDQLAAEGRRFTSAYVCGANCAPSRACLITGQFTPRHGVYAVDSTKRGPVTLMRLEPIPNTNEVAGSNFTIAKALKAAGYTTGWFGKWHIGPVEGDGPTTPKGQGFDVAMPERKLGGEEDPKRMHAVTRNACKFMEDNKSRPFFAYLAYHAIHGPQEAHAATLARFKEKTPGAQHDKPLYAACVYDFDSCVGEVVAQIGNLHLSDNTLIIFTSDNGATQASSQEPLRGNKGAYYEGGIRIPMIARWPGHIPAGSTCDTPVAFVDFYPTFLALAGAKPPPDKILDGIDITPVLCNEPAPRTASLFWHFPGYLNDPVIRGRDKEFRTRPVSVIRKGDWKLLLYHEEWVLDGGKEKLDTNHAVELYNLVEDIGERNDLALTRKDKRDELLADLLAWIESAKAPLPSQKNPAYDPAAPIVREPGTPTD